MTTKNLLVPVAGGDTSKDVRRKMAAEHAAFRKRCREKLTAVMKAELNKPWVERHHGAMMTAVVKEVDVVILTAAEHQALLSRAKERGADGAAYAERRRILEKLEEFLEP